MTAPGFQHEQAPQQQTKIPAPPRAVQIEYPLHPIQAPEPQLFAAAVEKPFPDHGAAGRFTKPVAQGNAEASLRALASNLREKSGGESP